MTLPSPAVSLKRPQRGVKEVRFPRLEETGSGLGFRRHAPTTCELRFSGSDLTAVSSLVDTGAGLSTIDNGLVERLGITPQGASLRVNGIGTLSTLGYVTLSFYIEGADETNNAVRLLFDQDFHVLPTFSPGVCLGQDWISGHKTIVDTAGKIATIRGYTFPVRGHLPPARSLSAKICTRRDTVIPPLCHTWVDADTAALMENVDYMLEPAFFHDPSHGHAVMAVACLLDGTTPRLLITNMGTDALELPSRAVLGHATALGPGTTSSSGGLAFPLSATSPMGAPFDPFEFDEQPMAADASSNATTLVDDVWTVGTDENRQPHSDVVKVLRELRSAFSLDGRPGHVKGPAMTIPVPDESRLKAEAPRRVSPEKRAAIEKQIAQLLEWDVVEDSNNPVSAPVHLVRQRDKLRFCVNYRHLNSATTPDRYPLPRIDDVLESLRGASWFSSLDAIRGYHQTDIAPDDRWKTAFATHKGLMQYKRVPFGLRSAPAFFQRLMDGILGPMRWVTALIYLDDVVIYTCSLRDHCDALRQLLTTAAEVGLRFSPSKCVFAVRELNLLGRKVSGHGLGVMEDRASAVRDLPRPHTLQELYHVLDFTKGWAYKKCGDSHRLVRQDGKVVSAKTEALAWTDSHQQSFDSIKLAISTPPTLAHPRYDRPFLLYTDASKNGFAAAVHQMHVLPAPAVVDAFPAWPQQSVALDREQWQTALRADPTFGPPLRRLETGSGPTADEPYLLRDGVLVRRDDGRLCLPRSSLVSVLTRVHDEGGHFGLAKTYRAIAADFWHPRLSSLVTAYVRHCLPCIRTKGGPTTGRLAIDSDARRPFEHMSLDVVLGPPRTRRGKDAIIVAVCTFSKLVLLQPCTSSFTARDITSFVMDRVVRLGWRPERLTSDRDLRIMGEAGRELGKLLGMEITTTPAHHHRANPVERHIQTVERVLRAMCPTRQGLWDEEVLPAVELAMNSAPSLATGMTAFDAIFIDSPRAVDAILRLPDHGGVGDWSERFDRARFRLLEARDFIRTERVRQRRNFDQRHADLPDVHSGSKVWVRLRNRPIPAAPSGKLAPLKIGPFPVRRVLSAHRVLVDVPPEYNIDGEFDLSQLELHPSEPGPFDRTTPTRVDTPPPPRDPSLLESPELESAAPRRGGREHRPAPMPRPAVVSSFPLDIELAEPLVADADVFSRPQRRSKTVTMDGVTVQLVERPVAFLSRATTPAEAKLTGPELELTCVAWAMTRAQHLLEGSDVTIVTDHAPVPGMLTSRTGLIPYGPVVEKARVCCVRIWIACDSFTNPAARTSTWTGGRPVATAFSAGSTGTSSFCCGGV